MPIHPDVRAAVDAVRIIDTHEHLEEEATRLSQGHDWSYLFSHYAADDLAVAGMPSQDLEQFLSSSLDIHAKWRLFEPVWPKAQNTGYCLAVRLAVEELYGEPEFSASTYVRIDEKMQAMARPGFYRDILARAGIDSCQVNALETKTIRTQTDRDVLLQDLSFFHFTFLTDVDGMARECGIEVGGLTDYLRVIDHYFERYGGEAVAVKNQGAYSRRIDFDEVNPEAAAPLFARRRAGETLPPAEEKAVQDCVFHHCVRRAIDHGLPVKLHTGYYAGRNGMPLERVGHNPADLCPLLKRYPEAKFVLMHIGYPYQDEMIALAKHYANAFVDLCWAWIICPTACVRFTIEFLTAAPANKLLGFGGDYKVIEPVVGHARIARLGLSQALSQLVEDGWMSVSEAEASAERVLRTNALELFPRALRAAVEATC
jgi:predicted TIM-barrel fold metal-dependent hydrolase